MEAQGERSDAEVKKVKVGEVKERRGGGTGWEA
jgi:hypothetical protein